MIVLNPPFCGNEALKRIADGTKIIRRNNKGWYVCLVQQSLLQFSPKCLEKHGPDGHWGDESIEACKSFQEYHGLDVDGIVGKNTLVILNDYYSKFDVKRRVDTDIGKQLRMLSVGECGLNTLGYAGAEFRTEVNTNGIIFRVTKMGSGDNTRYGWVVDNPTHKFHPETKDEEICALTADIESKRFFDNGQAYDAAAYSGGLFHDTIHSGNFQKIMFKFKELDPEAFNDCFNSLIWDVKKIKGEYILVDGDEDIIDLCDFRDLDYVEAFVNASHVKGMQEAMRLRMLKWLDCVRRNTAKPFGFTLLESEAVLLSLSVYLGMGGCRKYVRQVGHKDDWDETKRLQRLVELVPFANGRVNHVLESMKWKI